MLKRQEQETARQDLAVGLHTVTEINQAIRYADTKAAALAAILALGVTVLAARRGETAGLLPGVLCAAALLATLTSAALLALGQMPRLVSGLPSERPNRVAFPSLALLSRVDALAVRPPAAQREDVWRQANDLAVIAVIKYRWLHRALISTVGTLGLVLLWIAVTTWLR